MSIEQFTARISDAALADVTERLSRVRWPDTLPDSGWGYGADLETVREYAEHWLSLIHI